MNLLRTIIACATLTASLVVAAPAKAISDCGTGRSGPTGTSICHSTAGAGSIQRVRLMCKNASGVLYGPIYGPFTGVEQFSFKSCPGSYPIIFSVQTDKF